MSYKCFVCGVEVIWFVFVYHVFTFDQARLLVVRTFHSTLNVFASPFTGLQKQRFFNLNWGFAYSREKHYYKSFFYWFLSSQVKKSCKTQYSNYVKLVNFSSNVVQYTTKKLSCLYIIFHSFHTIRHTYMCSSWTQQLSLFKQRLCDDSVALSQKPFKRNSFA